MTQKNLISDTLKQLFIGAEIHDEELYKLRVQEDKEVFERKLKEGYTEVCFGFGEDWIGDRKVLGLYAFYHPNGRISAYEYPKIKENVTGFRPIEFEYNTRKTLLGKLLGINLFENSFKDHVKEFKIILDERKNLAELVKILGNGQNGL